VYLLRVQLLLYPSPEGSCLPSFLPSPLPILPCIPAPRIPHLLLLSFLCSSIFLLAIHHSLGSGGAIMCSGLFLLLVLFLRTTDPSNRDQSFHSSPPKLVLFQTRELFFFFSFYAGELSFFSLITNSDFLPRLVRSFFFPPNSPSTPLTCSGLISFFRCRRIWL